MALPSDKTPATKPEDDEAADVEQVEQEAETEAEGDAEEAEPSKAAEAAEADDDGQDDQVARKSSRYQRRIDEITRDKHEAERREEAALVYARQIMEENRRLKERTLSTSEIAASEGIARADSEIARAKIEHKEAFDLGDHDRVFQAQERAANALFEKKRLTEAALRLKSEANQHQAENQQVEQQVAQVQNAAPPPPDPKFSSWHKKNTWWGQNRVMTMAAWQIHQDIVRSGVDPRSDEYWGIVDERMREEFPHRFESAQQAEKKPATNVAPARRAGTGTQNQNGAGSKLTDSEKRVASRLGLTDAQYLEAKKEYQESQAQ